MKRTAKSYVLILILLVAATSMACGYIEPLKEKIAGAGNGSAQSVAEIVTPTKTPRPTFTPTPDWTPTPTFTLTPMPTPTPTITPTPLPTNTPTPVPPTATFTPAPPTNTPKPRPPTATFTPAPPTATPTPSFPFKLVEGPTGYPTTNPILVMYIALTDPNNVPIGGLKVVGDHTPSGLHWESAESCFDFCKASGTKGTIKFGNVTFEPPRYETGVWNLRVVDGGGTPVSDVISVPVDASSPGWFFMLLRRS